MDWYKQQQAIKEQEIADTKIQKVEREASTMPSSRYLTDRFNGILVIYWRGLDNEGRKIWYGSCEQFLFSAHNMFLFRTQNIMKTEVKRRLE